MNSLPSYLKNLLLLLVVLALVNVGCVSSPPCTASGGHGDLSVAVDGGGAVDRGHGHQRVSGEGKVAAWVLVGLLLALVVTIDLLILPATHHDPFPCCRAVVSICH